MMDFAGARGEKYCSSAVLYSIVRVFHHGLESQPPRSADFKAVSVPVARRKMCLAPRRFAPTLTLVTRSVSEAASPCRIINPDGAQSPGHLILRKKRWLGELVWLRARWFTLLTHYW